MKPALRIGIMVLVMAWGFHPGKVRAGMPSLTLADVPRTLSLSNLTRLRLESLSFFLLAFFLSAGMVQFAWNALRKDLRVLPRLYYGKSLALVLPLGATFRAAGRFKPWGDPTDLRDPVQIMSITTKGFGGPEGSGANLLFLDGSVRFLGARTDRTILKRLSHAAAPDTADRDSP